MAALQSIRSKGPLLVATIGLGLFAFIAGDAWKVIAPHQTQNVGEVNGESITAQEYQQMVEEYTDAVKFAQGLNALTEDQTDAVKDQVWNTFVNNKLLEKEANKLGLVVTDEEVQDIINTGTYPLLTNSPFRNQQTGLFDKDMLNMFLVQYSQMNAQTDASTRSYYEQVYNYWKFIEKNMRQNRLAEKYQALIAKSLFSNPVEAQAAYDARINETDMLMAAIPYSSVSDDDVTVTDADIQAAYNEKKEQFRQLTETRNLRYIDVQVVASDEDRAALQREMMEYTEQLGGEVEDYTSFIRSTDSEVPYVDLFYTTNALPSDVVARLDSVALGEAYGPYYNASDNSLTSFKKLAVSAEPDSIQFRQIQVTANTKQRTTELADSIFNALKGGADFAEIAQKYGQTGETSWISSANYEGAQIDNDNLKYIKAIVSQPKNQLVNLALNQANIILEVTDRKAVDTKYKVAVVKRPIEFSKDTYTKAYNDFSQFVATNNTLEKMVANAEDAGYRLYTANDVYNYDHNIGGIKGTREALKWAFGAKGGEASGLYECGESDHLMMVAVSGIIKEGYRPLALVSDDLRQEVLRDKKAEKIMADIKAAGATTIDQIKNMANAVNDSVKHVTFSAPAYITALRSTEPVVSAFAAASQQGQVSAPLKGQSGIIVLQPYASNKINDTFDAATEESRTVNTNVNVVGSQFTTDLYMKAKVTDNRYLYF